MSGKSREEIAQEFAQATLSAAPVIILGSGASAAHGLPSMWSLAAHLSSAAIPQDWSEQEIHEWQAFVERLQGGLDLESALQAGRPTEKQTKFVAVQTRSLLLPFDVAAFKALLTDRRALPLSRLYQHLFDSTHMAINVVTPNYDRIAEYAADAADLSAFTGFSYGYMQNRARSSNTRILVNDRPTRTVAIWKVHGSLDWFMDSTNQIVGVRTEVGVPDGMSPLMVTPGIDKYRLTHGEPFRTIISCSDAALERARAYMCIGYGFNDEHLQTKLIERCDRESIPIVIITKELTSIARNFLKGGRCRKFLAIEEGPKGSRVYTHDDPAGFDVSSSIWMLHQFLNFVGVSQ